MDDLKGYSNKDVDTKNIVYDPERDGVWVGDLIFLSRGAVLRALEVLVSEN